MSNNYRYGPLLENNDETDFGLNPSDKDQMRQPRIRRFRNKAFRLLISPQHFWILSISCFIVTAFFLAALYLNIDSLYALYNPAYDPSLGTGQEARNPVLFQKSFSRKKGLSIFDRRIRYKDFNYLNADSLTYVNRTYSNGLSILFRLPQKQSIFGLLLIFHGCGRSAADWFHTVERQRIIGAAIDLGYACLVFQSTDRMRRCWSSTDDIYLNEDVQMVLKGLENFYEEYPKFESLPRLTFGASSGGIFSSVFAVNQRYKIQGQILFISIILPDVLNLYVKATSYPPTAWIHMLGDIEFASKDRIQSSMKIFARENISHIAFEIEPISLTSKTFHERIPSITADTSRYIFYRLQQQQWLDLHDSLVHNPRRNSGWKEFLFDKLNETAFTPTILKNLRAHETILPDFLNTVYGEHEISFERSFEALNWLKSLVNNQTVSTL